MAIPKQTTGSVHLEDLALDIPTPPNVTLSRDKSFRVTPISTKKHIETKLKSYIIDLSNFGLDDLPDPSINLTKKSDVPQQKTAKPVVQNTKHPPPSSKEPAKKKIYMSCIESYPEFDFEVCFISKVGTSKEIAEYLVSEYNVNKSFWKGMEEANYTQKDEYILLIEERVRK